MAGDKKDEELRRLLGKVGSAKVKVLADRLGVEGDLEVVRAGVRILEWYLDKREQGFEHQLAKGGRVYEVYLSDLID